MGRNVYSPQANPGNILGPIPIEQQGTGSATVTEAANRLGYIPFSMLGTANGVVLSDESALVATNLIDANAPNKPATLVVGGLVSVTDIPDSITAGVSLYGASSLYVNQTSTYTITGYDMATTYNVSATVGTVSRVADIITYTAPASAGSGGFTVNGKAIAITIMAAGVTTPSVTSPTSNSSGPSGTKTFVSTAFAYSGVSDTQQSSDWQLATDAGFTNITIQSMGNTTGLVTWTATGLLANTTHYVRVRHNGTSLGASAWSAGIVFTTTDVSVSGVSSLYVNQASSFTITNYDSGVVYTVVANGGSVSRNAGVITYTAPATAGNAGFSVNGKGVSVTVNAAAVVTPSVTSPVNLASGMGTTTTITSSAFSVTGASDTHQSTSWQVATDAGFTNIVANLMDSSSNLLSWSASNLSVSTTYYVRVRYKGASLGYSQWSSANRFTTNNSAYTPNSELQRIVDPGGSYIGNNGDHMFSETGCMSADGNTAVIGSRNNHAFVYQRSGGSFTLNQVLRLSSNESSVGYIWGFGEMMAMSKNGLVLAIVVRSDGNSSHGVSFYEKLNGVWTFADFVINSSGNPKAISISADGNVCVVSAQGTGATTSFINTFVRSGNSWVSQSIISQPGYSANSFANAISLSEDGNVLAAASGGNEINDSLFVFRKSGSSWGSPTVLYATHSTTKALYGYLSLSGDGNTILSYGKNAAGVVATHIFKYTSSWILENDTLSINSQPVLSYDGRTFGAGAYVDIVSQHVPAIDFFTRDGSAWSFKKQVQCTSVVDQYSSYGRLLGMNSAATAALVGSPGTLTSGSSVANGAAYILG